MEPLEGRALLASPGADYVLSGTAWANPSRITYSIAPDGVFWDHGTNTLASSFDARFGPGRWEREIARALATWQSVANLNIAAVPDGPFDEDALGQAQGDPRFGDIRFGGYAFPNNTTTLARTYGPPPNGSTAGGDVVINTGLNFNIGSDYDLFSVMLHETGHSLGLEHPSNATQVMYASYQGVRPGLAPGDVAGIQAIYGARRPDPFQAAGRGTNVGTAVELSPALDASRVAVLTGVSLDTVGDTEFFTVVAPAGSTGRIAVTAAATGVSMLSPRVTVFDAAGRPLDSAANPAAWGTTVSAHADGVAPGQRFIVAVSGATSDVFSVGGYTLGVAFSGPAATNPTPGNGGGTTPLSPPGDRFEPNGGAGNAAWLGTVSQRVVGGLTLNTSADVDTFAFANTRAGVYVVSAAGGALNVRVYDALGNTVTQGTGQVGLRITRPRTVLYVEVSSASGVAVPGYSLGIAALGTVRLRSGLSLPRAQTTVAVPVAELPAWARSWSAARPAARRG